MQQPIYFLLARVGGRMLVVGGREGACPPPCLWGKKWSWKKRSSTPFHNSCLSHPSPFSLSLSPPFKKQLSSFFVGANSKRPRLRVCVLVCEIVRERSHKTQQRREKKHHVAVVVSLVLGIGSGLRGGSYF